MIFNRKMRRKFQFQNHHNIFTKKYSSSRAREAARKLFFGVDKKSTTESVVA